jgi:hypothetical protein
MVQFVSAAKDVAIRMKSKIAEVIVSGVLESRSLSK